jgi:hypothetical protein
VQRKAWFLRIIVAYGFKEKYNYNPWPTYDKGALFVMFMEETWHIQSMGFSKLTEPTQHQK